MARRVREERKLKLKPKLNRVGDSAGSNPAPGIPAGVAQQVEAVRPLKLRLSLQTQHSPPIAGSRGRGRSPLRCRFESGSLRSWGDGVTATREGLSLIRVHPRAGVRIGR
jgi:hypothetical protein